MRATDGGDLRSRIRRGRPRHTTSRVRCGETDAEHRRRPVEPQSLRAQTNPWVNSEPDGTSALLLLVLVPDIAGFVEVDDVFGDVDGVIGDAFEFAGDFHQVQRAGDGLRVFDHETRQLAV